MSQTHATSDPYDMKHVLEALTGAIDRMAQRIDTLEDKVEQSTLGKNASKRQPYVEELGDSNNEEDMADGNRFRNYKRIPNQGDDELKGIKLKIPTFPGKSDPEAYLEWERKIEMLFDCNHYSESQKVKLATIEFTEYAAVWWDQIRTRQRRHEEPLIRTWEELKRIMRKRFIPAYYHRDLHHKLQTLTQGSMTVEDYFKEMEMAMLRADVREDIEATMARFLRGLHAEIADVVELQHYLDMDELLDKAIKVERRLKRRGIPHQSSNVQSGNWRTQQYKGEITHTSEQKSAKASGVSNGAWVPGSSSSTPTQRAEFKADLGASKPRNRDTKCFKCQGFGHIASQCPNRRTMLMLPSGEVLTDEEDEYEGMPPLVEEEEIIAPDQPVGLGLVTRLALSAQRTNEEEQRTNIFYTRCLVNGKVCSLIIDGGSCTNVASALFVKKLHLPVQDHPTPYKLQWFSDCGEVRVSKQVSVKFNIGRYEDELVCDVVPMQAAHLILGRPWQFDREVTYEGHSNKYSFMHKGTRVILVPLSPTQVREDQNVLQREWELDRLEGKEKKGRTLIMLAKPEDNIGHWELDRSTFVVFNVFSFVQVVRGQISFILQCAIPATIEICEESAGQVISTNTSRVTLAFDAVFARLDAYNSQPNQTLVHRASAHDPPIGLRRRLCDHCHGNLAVRNMYLPPPRVVLVPHKDVMIILRLRRRHAGCLVTIHMLSSLLFCKRVMIWGQIAFKRRGMMRI